MPSQYKICLTASAVAILSLGMVLNRVYFALILISGLAAWLLTNSLIPQIKQYMLKASIFGLDINKKGSERGQKKIPECVGFASATAFIIVGYFYWPQQQQTVHMAVMLTILSTILLGFADDMLDLKWRYKLIFPFFFIVPTLKVFTGSTSIALPYPLSSILTPQLDLSYIYYFYIVLLCIYFTNTINIYAGINGLEVGQSIIAACSQLILFSVRSLTRSQIVEISVGEIQIVPPVVTHYEYSSFLLLVFLGASLALMKYNAYPSQVFVGDTFCYFAGITLAMSSVFSESSIICHFFMIPQLINFLYSVPQLFGFYPCPRHRLAQYNPQTDQLISIRTNMNLLNLSLRILGPTNEGELCSKLLIFQMVTSFIGIILGIYF